MAKPTFESAMKRLEEIVQELEGGALNLDEALKTFQEGIKLSRFCAKKLDEAEKKVSILLQDESGNVRSEAFEDESSEINADG
jgi:exodeoxyribonuclease VII small subunit